MIDSRTQCRWRIEEIAAELEYVGDCFQPEVNDASALPLTRIGLQNDVKSLARIFDEANGRGELKDLGTLSGCG
jgi:hypothetical protein